VAAILVFKLIGYSPIKNLERFAELPARRSSKAKGSANERTWRAEVKAGAETLTGAASFAAENHAVRRGAAFDGYARVPAET